MRLIGEGAVMPIQLNCPKCPQRMEFSFTTSDGKVSVYHCRVHGEWHLGEGGVRAPGEILPPQDLSETG
jgi:hypothetical protein